MPPARPHLFGLLAGLFLATGLVLAAFLVARAWTRLSETNVVNVTGSARKNVRSDLIVWRTCFHVDAATLPAAQRQLQEQLAQATAHLAQSGLTDVAVAPVEVQELTVRARDADGEEATVRRVGYRLLQRLEIRSTDVERVPRLAADTSALIEQGIVFSSHEFQFIYTKAGEAKVEMMAEATKDARARADQIARQGGSEVAGLRSARMGVVQINPLHSNATSWEGNNDTSALDKTITATVSAVFSLR